jgi:hypothetical protein
MVQLPSELRKNQSVGRDDKATLQIGHDIELSGFSVIAQFRRDALCIVVLASNKVRHDGSPFTQKEKAPRWG